MMSIIANENYVQSIHIFKGNMLACCNNDELIQTSENV